MAKVNQAMLFFLLLGLTILVAEANVMMLRLDRLLITTEQARDNAIRNTSQRLDQSLTKFDTVTDNANGLITEQRDYTDKLQKNLRLNGVAFHNLIQATNDQLNGSSRSKHCPGGETTCAIVGVLPQASRTLLDMATDIHETAGAAQMTLDATTEVITSPDITLAIHETGETMRELHSTAAEAHKTGEHLTAIADDGRKFVHKSLNPTKAQQIRDYLLLGLRLGLRLVF